MLFQSSIAIHAAPHISHLQFCIGLLHKSGSCQLPSVPRTDIWFLQLIVLSCSAYKRKMRETKMWFSLDLAQFRKMRETNMQHILLLHYAIYSVWYSSFRFLPVFWWLIPIQFWCEPTTPLCKMSNNFTDMMIGRPGTERVAKTECLFCLCKTKTDCLKLVLINTIKLQW